MKTEFYYFQKINTPGRPLKLGGSLFLSSITQISSALFAHYLRRILAKEVLGSYKQGYLFCS